MNNYNYPGTPLYSGNSVTPNQTNSPNIQNEYIPDEQSYIENILRLNRGKKVSIYQSFADADEWKDKVCTRCNPRCGAFGACYNILEGYLFGIFESGNNPCFRIGGFGRRLGVGLLECA